MTHPSQSGLFSASVTAFIVESYKTLMSSTGDSSHTVMLLAQISLQLAAISNGSLADAQPPLPTFKPTPSARRVNAFWFLSLCFGLACALAAILVQQWARIYLQAIEHRPAPHKKARIRAFLFHGIESFGMKTVVEGIPTLMHIAVFLFLAGLVDFLFTIDRLVAHTTLAIVTTCAALYLFITFLPILRWHCPYRTPLSAICWRILQFLGILQYIDVLGSRQNIEGSMEQGRELLATEESSGRDQRDREALLWTMEALTDNIELEPFVEGIPAFLSDGSYQVASLMRELMSNQDVALMDRIVKLLLTCKEPGVLTEDRRLKRAVACLNAIASLAQIVNIMAYSTSSVFNEGLARTLMTFTKDKTTQACANSTVRAVAATIQYDIADAVARTSMHSCNVTKRSLSELTLVWALQPEVHNISGRLKEVSTAGLESALHILHTLESLESIFEQLPDLMRKHSNSSLMVTLLWTCHYQYLPKLLLACQTSGSYQETLGQRRMVLYMKAACNAHRIYHSTTISIISTLRQDSNSDIAAYAICAAARLACHLQWDILNSVRISSCRLPASLPQRALAVYSQSEYYRMLDLLDVLYAFEDDTKKVELRRVLRLGVDTESSYEDVIKLELQQVDLLSQDDVHHLEKPALRNLEHGGKDRCACGHCDSTPESSRFVLASRIAIHRGHLVILVGFLQSIATSSLPSLAGLDFILETLNFLTENLVARLASHHIQAVLAEMVGKCARMYCMLVTDEGLLKFSDKEVTRRIRSIVDALFGVLSTIGDPDVISYTKAIITEYLAHDPTCGGAEQTLRKVRACISLLGC